MIVYVDDFKIAGMPGSLDKAWELITKVKVKEDDGKLVEAIKLGKITEVDNFLGCSHHVEKFETEGGRSGNTMIWEMHKFMVSCFERYKEVAHKHDPKYEIHPLVRPSLTRTRCYPYCHGPCSHTWMMKVPAISIFSRLIFVLEVVLRHKQHIQSGSFTT